MTLTIECDDVVIKNNYSICGKYIYPEIARDRRRERGPVIKRHSKCNDTESLAESNAYEIKVAI